MLRIKNKEIILNKNLNRVALIKATYSGFCYLIALFTNKLSKAYFNRGLAHLIRFV